jgi:DNA primase
VAFDGDSAGYRDAVRAYSLLCSATDDLDAVDFPLGQDPAHVLVTREPAALAAALTVVPALRRAQADPPDMGVAAARPAPPWP